MLILRKYLSTVVIGISLSGIVTAHASPADHTRGALTLEPTAALADPAWLPRARVLVPRGVDELTAPDRAYLIEFLLASRWHASAPSVADKAAPFATDEAAPGYAVDQRPLSVDFTDAPAASSASVDVDLSPALADLAGHVSPGNVDAPTPPGRTTWPSFYGAESSRVILPTAVSTSATGTPGAFTDLVASAPVQAHPAPLLVAPQANALPSGFTLYTADSSGGIISAITGSGTVATYKTIGSGDELFGIGAFGGSLYVVDAATNAVDRIVLSTGTVSQFASLASTAGGPTALTIDKSGNVYVALTNNGGTIVKISTAGAVSLYATLPTSGSANAEPQGLVFDASGNLYSSDYGTRNIVKISNGGATVAPFVSFPTGTYSSTLLLGGLAIDQAGNLYVSDQDTHSNAAGAIYKVTTAGVISLFANAGVGKEPVGLAFDANGILYTADVDGVEQISTTGVVSAFATDSNQPAYLVVVPEPATSLGGLGLLATAALAMRRHGRRA